MPMPAAGAPSAGGFQAFRCRAALKVRTALARLEAGNTGALKAVGKGVHEIRIDFGPGYRVYLGMDGAELIVLLGGSAKSRQSIAIQDAQGRWQDYRQRKRRGE
jgi:putative addiction module killer protein